MYISKNNKKEATINVTVLFPLNLICLVFIVLFPSILYSNDYVEPCGTMQNLEVQIKQNPLIEKKIADYENFVKERTQTARQENRKTGPQDIVTIPIVFHVVYANDVQNLPDSIFLSQIELLNDDFRATNDDIVDIMPEFQDRIGDFEIEFCLAQQDKEGLPHSGITRTFTTNTNFSIFNNDINYDDLGGKDAWPSDKYLNIWVCSLTDAKGFAQFPGSDADIDGIILDFQYTGNISSNGRAASHEVGHWLGLRHIWGDGPTDLTDYPLGSCPDQYTDYVDDTPKAIGPTVGCPIGANTCSNESPDLPDMVENFMDYSVLDCANGMFSQGQVERGRLVFEPDGLRFSITESTVCQPSNVENLDAQLIEILSPFAFNNYCENEIPTSLKVRNFGIETITDLIIRIYVNGGLALVHNWDGMLLTGDYVDIEMNEIELEAGLHEIEFRLHKVNGGDDNNLTDNIATTTILIKGGELPVVEGFEQAQFPPAYFEVDNPDLNKSWNLTDEAAHTGTQCMYLRCFNYGNTFTYDDLILPAIDLRNYNYPELEFYSAYARYDSEDSDTLEVLVSSDCGETFNSVYKRSGALLASAANTTSEFFPTASEWKVNNIDLSDYIGSEEVIVRIRCINSFENNLYVDDINLKNVSPPVGIEEKDLINNINLYPNPAQNQFSIEINLVDNYSAVIKITNLQGQLVYSNSVLDQNQLIVNTQHFESGVYFVNVRIDGLNKTEKLVISK